MVWAFCSANLWQDFGKDLPDSQLLPYAVGQESTGWDETSVFFCLSYVLRVALSILWLSSASISQTTAVRGAKTCI